MPLVTAQQFSLDPNILGNVQQGLVSRQLIQQEENKRRLREQEQAQLGTRQRALGVPEQVPTDETQQQATQRLIAADPKAAEDVLRSVGIVDQIQKEEAAAFATTALGAQPDQQVDMINQRVREITARGGDPSHTLMLLDQEPQERAASLKGLEATALTALQRQKVSPKAATQTSLVKNLIAAGFKQGTPEFQAEVIKGLKKAPLVQVGGGREEQKELAKLRAQDLGTLRAKGIEAEEQLTSLDILENIDVRTGAAEPVKLALAAFAEGFGIDASVLANVPAGQGFTAEAGKVVLRVLATQKGPQTDNDRKNIAKTIVRLGNSPEANVFINDAARSTARRTVEQRDFFNDWLDQNDTLKGAASAWNALKRDVPMVSRYVKTADGLPVFFFRFKDRVQEANPDASLADIKEAWRSQESAAKASR